MLVESTLFDPDNLPTDAQLRRMYRKSNPETSKQAAKKVKVGSQKHHVLEVFQQAYPKGFTDEELIEACYLKNDNARKRRVDLYNDGLVENTGLTRLTSSDCPAIVWRYVK